MCQDTRLIPGIVTDILYSIDVNTGEKKPAQTLSKNEIASCRISLVDKIVADTFEKHKTLGELILIDRVTNMTSACGVVTEITEEKTQKQHIITGEIRSAMKGQNVLNALFTYEVDSIKKEWIQDIDRELTLSGRHTYLYEPQEGEPAAKIVKHLNAAGIIVLLALNSDRKDIEEIKKSIEKEKIAFLEITLHSAEDVSKVAGKIRRKTVYS